MVDLFGNCIFQLHFTVIRSAIKALSARCEARAVKGNLRYRFLSHVIFQASACPVRVSLKMCEIVS